MSGGTFMAATPVVAAGGGLLMPLIIVLFLVISAVRAMVQAQRARQEHEAGGGESESERRAREIRERLRRVIAERRGLAEPDAGGPSEAEPGRRGLPGRVPPIDPFGGPLRRILEELAPPPARPPAEPPVFDRPSGPVTRPDKAAAERAAEQHDPQREGPAMAAPAPTQPRRRIEAVDASLRRTEARDRLLGDLRDPHGLRRAFVLREVLGPPVSLRR